MKKSTEVYRCSFCGKEGVKLWRPYLGQNPLICAECAEKRQAEREFEEKEWKKQAGGGYIGVFTGRRLPMPRWEVDEKGTIPSNMGPSPEGLPEPRTDQLIIDLSDISDELSWTDMIPARPAGNGKFLGYYTSVSEKLYKWWDELPTK